MVFSHPEGKRYVPEGYNFSFVHPVSETCHKGQSGLSFTRNLKTIQISNTDLSKAIDEALQRAPTCDDCGVVYDFYARGGRYGKWVKAQDL